MVDMDAWCFICKDGGDLVSCDYKGCYKVYHTDCLNVQDLPDDWSCECHSCKLCDRRAYYRCLTCPRALCQKCIAKAKFASVKGFEGFCLDCLKLVNVIEENQQFDSDGERINFFKDLTTPNGLFEDYYFEEIKERHGLLLDDIHAAERRCEEKLGRVKQFAAIIAANLKTVYLRKGLLKELEEDAETFQGKVRGAYVGVKREPSSNPELQQIKGVKKSKRTNNRQLVVSNFPKKLTLESSKLSDSPLREEECVVLMQKIKDGLIRKPTVNEVQEKARVLHVDMTKHIYYILKENDF